MMAWLLFLALVGSAAVSGFQQNAPAPAQPVSVSGRVVDAATGRGVDGAFVVARPPTGSLVHRVLTDRGGQFRFDGLVAGHYQLSASASGYINGTFGQRRPEGAPAPLQLSPGQNLSGVEVRLWRVATIAGRVLDDAGEPRPGVGVAAFRRRDIDRAAGSYGIRTFTDDRGDYELIVPPGDYVVAVPVMHLTWALTGQRGMFLAGNDWLPSHRALADGRFQLRLEEGLETPATSSAKTPRTFVTTFHPSVARPQDASTVIAASGDVLTGIDIQLRTAPHRRVSGRAVDERGQPLKQVALRAIPVDVPTPRDGQDWSTIRAASRPDGTFSFLRIPPGSYVLEAFRDLGESDVRWADSAGYWASMPLAVGDRDLEDLVVQLVPGVEVRGTVVVEGGPPPRGRLSLGLIDEHGQSSGVDSGAGSGQLRITGVRPGRYLMMPAMPRGYVSLSLTLNGRDILDVPTDVGPGGLSGLVLTITDRRTLLEGTVTGSDGRPVGGSVVAVFPATPADRQPFGERRLRMQHTTTLASGVFRLADLPPGSYIAAAMSEEEADAWPDPKLLDALAARGSVVVLPLGDPQRIALRLESR